jgi:octaprenyl-diphosphate synthase
VRPALLLMAARLAGYDGDQAIRYAAVVEFIHTATLVHDDIIDDSDLRRGRLAVHSRWGNDITVLLGDYLYIKSMALALTYDSLEIIRLLCDTTLRMIEGELYQLTKNGDADITEDEHFDIMRRKTAYLFGGARRSAACSAACPPPTPRRCGNTVQPRHDLPAGRRPARLHRRRAGRRQAGGQRPARRQSHAAADPPAAPAAGRRRQPDHSRRHRVANVTGEQWDDLLRSLKEHASIDYAYRRAVEFAERAKKPLTRFRRARSATRCSRCRTTCCPAIGDCASDPTLTLEITDGDIAAQDTDAIVNAANNAFWMGAGVAGAIKSRGGAEIEREAMAQGPVEPGACVVTSAGRLAARHVIHAAVMGQDLVTSAAIRHARDIQRAAARATNGRCSRSRFQRSAPASADSRSTRCARIMIGAIAIARRSSASVRLDQAGVVRCKGRR